MHYMYGSCEIEDFVETHPCMPCAILRSREILGVVLGILVKDIGRRLPLELACIRVNRVMLINLRTETIKPVLRGAKSDGCGTL